MNRRQLIQALLGSSTLAKAADQACTITVPVLCPITTPAKLPKPSASFRAPTLKPRKNASQITREGGWQFYIDAYNAWFARGAGINTPDSPEWFRFIHEHYCSHTELDVHKTWAFLPWHRAFLAYHESTIAELDKKFKDFRVPVWDWDTDQAVPEPFRAFQPWLEAAAGKYGPHPPKILDWSQNWLSQWVSGENWKQFVGTADQPVRPGAAQYCHVYVHGMDKYFADFSQCAGDPLFYMHHANVDRFWSYWQKTLENRQHPDFAIDPAFYRQTFYFPSPFLPVQGKDNHYVAAETVRKAESLGYTYDLPTVDITPVVANPIIISVSDPPSPDVLSDRLLKEFSAFSQPQDGHGDVLVHFGHVLLPDLRLTLLVDPVHEVQHVNVLLVGAAGTRYPVGQFVLLPHLGAMTGVGKIAVTVILHFANTQPATILGPDGNVKPTLLLLPSGSDQATPISRSQIIEAAFLSKPLIPNPL